MANSEELEGEFNSDNLTTDLLKLEKQIIMSPNSHNPSSNCWSMVVIKDSNQESSIVFPPAHHENLQLRPSISTEELPNPHCSSSIPSSSPSSSSSTVSTLLIENENDSTSLVFPPAHHENLHLRPSISTEELQKPHWSSCSPSSSSSSSAVSTLSIGSEDDSSSITPLSPTGRDDKMVYLVSTSRAKDLTRHVFMDWVYFGLQLSIEKVKGIILRPSLFTSLLLLGYVYFQQRRLNYQQRRRAALLQQGREKDQRISQLLNQITRMNEVMLILQRNSATSIKK